MSGARFGGDAGATALSIESRNCSTLRAETVGLPPPLSTHCRLRRRAAVCASAQSCGVGFIAATASSSKGGCSDDDDEPGGCEGGARAKGSGVDGEGGCGASSARGYCRGGEEGVRGGEGGRAKDDDDDDAEAAEAAAAALESHLDQAGGDLWASEPALPPPLLPPPPPSFPPPTGSESHFGSQAGGAAAAAAGRRPGPGPSSSS